MRSIQKYGFTIVELVVIIAVIGVIATLATIGINRYTAQAVDEKRESNATAITTALEKYYDKNGEYPSCTAVTGSVDSVSTLLGGIDKTALVAPNAPEGTTNSIMCGEGLSASSDEDIFVYEGDGSLACSGSGACSTYILKYWNDGTQTAVEVQSKKKPLPLANGAAIQTATSVNCPTTRTRVVDTRDNRTYWVQKLGDECWMLTNLAYTGGGTNTYGDVKTLSNGTGGSNSYTAARYYVHTSGSNPTTEPTAPSTSTSGTGQYGYLYNWCAAMGAQTSTSACANATTPVPNPNVSICPAGWKLPSSTEFTNLNSTVNGGQSETDEGLRSLWLGQYSGGWSAAGFERVGDTGSYWYSAQSSASNALSIAFEEVNVSDGSSTFKYFGNAVRCVI